MSAQRDAVRDMEGQARAAAPRLRALASLLTDHRRELDASAREEMAEELRAIAARLDTSRRMMSVAFDDEVTQRIEVPRCD